MDAVAFADDEGVVPKPKPPDEVVVGVPNASGFAIAAVPNKDGVTEVVGAPKQICYCT